MNVMYYPYSYIDYICIIQTYKNIIMESKFIPLGTAQLLQESICWFDHYKTPTNETHKIARNKFEIDKENTVLLRELGKINVRRQEIIEKLMNNKG